MSPSGLLTVCCLPVLPVATLRCAAASATVTGRLPIGLYTASLSAADFYQYGSPYAASYNGYGPIPSPDRSHLFLAETSDGLALPPWEHSPNQYMRSNSGLPTISQSTAK